MEKVIVSRHPAAIEFIARALDGEMVAGAGVPVIASASAEDVRGKHVYGNLPLHLAALAARVTVVEFEGAPPRGQEYSLADMDAAGAVLRSYNVNSLAS